MTAMNSTKTAFVLSGGGLLGSTQVGMLHALLERDIHPDLILGASIGALNGAGFAQNPTMDGVHDLTQLWLDVVDRKPFSGSVIERVSTLAKQKVAIFDNSELKLLLEQKMKFKNIEELPIQFQCVAASIERAAETWFERGEIVPAVLASAAAPGIYPPVKIDNEHYFDGGIVNPIPVDRARKLGATRIFVLQVGRIEQALTIPTNPIGSALTALEVARRARFNAAFAKAEETIEMHLLPTGSNAVMSVDRAAFDPREAKRVVKRMDSAYQATGEYLAKI